MRTTLVGALAALCSPALAVNALFPVPTDVSDMDSGFGPGSDTGNDPDSDPFANNPFGLQPKNTPLPGPTASIGNFGDAMSLGMSMIGCAVGVMQSQPTPPPALMSAMLAGTGDEEKRLAFCHESIPSDLRSELVTYWPKFTSWWEESKPSFTSCELLKMLESISIGPSLCPNAIEATTTSAATQTGFSTVPASVTPGSNGTSTGGDGAKVTSTSSITGGASRETGVILAAVAGAAGIALAAL